MEGQNGLRCSIIDEFFFSNTQRDQMEGESSVTRSIIE